MPSLTVVRNPALNEFTWDLLYNITPEQRSKLSRPFLSILCSSVKTKSFCENSSLDEKVRLFSELGLDNALIFFQDKKVTSVNSLKVILEKYQENKQAGASSEIAKLKVFVSSDKTVKWLLGFMADTISHKSYFLNLAYNRLGFHIKGWNKDRNTPESKELKETINSGETIVKTFLNASVALSYSEGLLGLRPLDLQILMYLYGFKHTYIEKEKIYSFFVPSVVSPKVTNSLKRLFLAGHIQKHLDLSPRYTITGSGLESVNRYVNNVIKHNEF